MAAVVAACSAHGFAQTAVLQEGPFQGLYLPVEQVIGNPDNPDDHIRHNCRVGVLNSATKGFVARVGPAIQFPQPLSVGVLRRPFFQTLRSQKITIVGQELFEAGARDIGQFEFHFFGRPGRNATFHDILFAGSGCLDHLVYRSVSLVEESAAEVDRGIVNDLCFLKGKQSRVTPVRWDETRHLRCESIWHRIHPLSSS